MDTGDNNAENETADNTYTKTPNCWLHTHTENSTTKNICTEVDAADGTIQITELLMTVVKNLIIIMLIIIQMIKLFIITMLKM